MGFTFTSKNGFCPECIAFGLKWYIKDKEVGTNLFDYCLMSVSTDPQPVYQFHDKKEVAAWLIGTGELRETDEGLYDYFIRRYTKIDYSDAALVEKDGVQYRFDKQHNTLSMLPKPRQETDWVTGYRQCLAEAKELLRSMAIC